jgi:predicted PurR-regulated permease PerM
MLGFILLPIAAMFIRYLISHPIAMMQFIMCLFGILMLFLGTMVYYQVQYWIVVKKATNGIISTRNLPKLVRNQLHYSGDWKKVRYIDKEKVFIKK